MRQGCVLSSDFFSLYAENVILKVVAVESIKINYEPINNLRYADNTVLMADSTQALEQLMSSLQIESHKRGLTINKIKTKIMVLSKKTEPRSEMFIDGEKLEQNNQFDYLGSLVTSDCKCDKKNKKKNRSCKKRIHRKRRF